MQICHVTLHLVGPESFVTAASTSLATIGTYFTYLLTGTPPKANFYPISRSFSVVKLFLNVFSCRWSRHGRAYMSLIFNGEELALMGQISIHLGFHCALANSILLYLFITAPRFYFVFQEEHFPSIFIPLCALPSLHPWPALEHVQTLSTAYRVTDSWSLRKFYMSGRPYETLVTHAHTHTNAVGQGGSAAFAFVCPAAQDVFACVSTCACWQSTLWIASDYTEAQWTLKCRFIR